MEEKQTAIETILFRHLMAEVDDYTILPLNKAGVITVWNESAKRLTGYESTEVVDQPFAFLFTDKEALPNLLNQARQQGRANSNGWINCRNGNNFWSRIVITAIPHETDKASSFTGFIQNLSATQPSTEAPAKIPDSISELEKVNRKLLRENANYKREVQAITYAVSHDLQAPLRAVTGYSDILQEDYQEKLDDEALNILNTITRNVGRINHLIKEILEFSRLNRRDISPKTLDMTQAFSETYHKLLALEPTSRTIEFQLADLPSGYGDPVLIDRVITNLLSNAIKFTRPREVAEIKVKGQIEGDACVYSIQDNGVGFDERYKDKLFEIFQRLHKGEAFEGVGMGLSVVQQIIHNHDGTVGGTGQPDRGATFFFTLPLINK